MAWKSIGRWLKFLGPCPMGRTRKKFLTLTPIWKVSCRREGISISSLCNTAFPIKKKKDRNKANFSFLSLPFAFYFMFCSRMLNIKHNYKYLVTQKRSWWEACRTLGTPISNRRHLSSSPSSVSDSNLLQCTPCR